MAHINVFKWQSGHVGSAFTDSLRSANKPILYNGFVYDDNAAPVNGFTLDPLRQFFKHGYFAIF